MEVLTGKALSFLLEFIDESGEKVSGLQMQIKLNLIVFFNRVVLNTKRIHNSFEEVSPQ